MAHLKKVTILIFDHCTPLASVGAFELFRKASLLHQQLTGSETLYFKPELATLYQSELRIDESFTIKTSDISNVDETDILLIPAIEFDIEEKLKALNPYIPHILRLHEKGAVIGSMCTGAFLLAKSGLLDGKVATTHWAMRDLFQKMYPEVELMDEKIIVDNGKIVSCGGATSFMHLILYLVEKYCGKETAIFVSKMLLLDYHKDEQSGFAIFNPQLEHQDQVIKEIQRMLHSANGEKFSVTYLAKKANLSISSFNRRFKKATGEVPSNYLQRLQVEKAKVMLEKKQVNSDELAYSLGYNDVPSFRLLFKKHTGFTPKEYQRKFNKDSAFQVSLR